MSLPQSHEEEKLMDKTLWDFMMKKAANKMSHLIEEEHTIWIHIAAESEFVPEDSVRSKLAEFGIDADSREGYYAPNGKLDFYQSWTNEKLKVSSYLRWILFKNSKAKPLLFKFTEKKINWEFLEGSYLCPPVGVQRMGKSKT